MPTPVLPVLCTAGGRRPGGGYTPAMQRGQMASRGGLVSNREVPGNMLSMTGVRMSVWKVMIITMDRAAIYLGLSICLTNISDKVKFTEG